MNKWLSNYKEYKGLQNALCISCFFKHDCAVWNNLMISLNLEPDPFCNGINYKLDKEPKFIEVLNNDKP